MYKRQVLRWCNAAGVKSKHSVRTPKPIRQQAARLIEDGLTNNEVCIKLGIGRSVVKRAIQEAGIQSVPHASNRRDTMIGKYPEASRRLNRGESVAVIARALGLTKDRVRRFRAQHSKYKRALQQVRRGGDYFQVAKSVGVSEITVRRWCHEERVKPEPLLKKLEIAEKRIESLNEELEEAQAVIAKLAEKNRFLADQRGSGGDQRMEAEVGKAYAANRKLKQTISTLEADLEGKLESKREKRDKKVETLEARIEELEEAAKAYLTLGDAHLTIGDDHLFMGFEDEG